MSFHDLHRILTTSSPYDDGSQDTSESAISFLSDFFKVLVVGAGGLGCEILKCLVMSGFKDITVIDMDTIDVSNLNRQFLFRETDVGRPKAVAAAEFVNNRCGHLGVNVKSKVCRIQELPESFYQQFLIIIAGLDNIPARRWLNGTVFSLLRRDANGNSIPASIKFLLDGGTEGLKGQARVIVPTMTACFECTLDTFPPVTTYPLCTIAETPRLPEHCIEYAMTVMFENAFPGKSFSAENDADLEWVFHSALERALKFNIEGVTKSLTKGVTKRIIPAVASTNALIASAMVNEAFKIATYSNPVMSNYFMYMGQTGINCQTFAYERRPECLVCGNQEMHVITLSSTESLGDLIQRLIEDPKLMLTKPSLSCKMSGNVVFMQNPPSLRKQLEYKLDRQLSELRQMNEFDTDLTVTDPALQRHITIRIEFI
jgi:ubiquitin-activating enzyme E1 C